MVLWLLHSITWYFFGNAVIVLFIDYVYKIIVVYKILNLNKILKWPVCLYMSVADLHLLMNRQQLGNSITDAQRR